jgi:2-dehydro-3-deoxyphosphooctonate aldolase (KDO 8-P synthase)
MDICGYKITGRQRFFLIAGPCVIESRDLAFTVAEELKKIAQRLNLFLVFKSSYDKANRSSVTSFRGPGIFEGLKILADIKKTFGIPVTTDVHSIEEIEEAKHVVDIIQIPAFLCRQTDLITSAGKTGKPVNVKKGQFLAPGDVINIVEKLRESGCRNYMITERGFSFGYNNLVVDMRSFEIIRSAGTPVIFDATHSTQLPGGGAASGGERKFVPILARSAAAAGIDGLFMEVHPYPDKALCDSTNQYYLDRAENLLKTLVGIDNLVKENLK